MFNELVRSNFRRHEFQCKGFDRCCGGAAPIDEKLLDGLQALRDKVGWPITVNSGFRCPKHNARIGGSPRSQHMLGKAADISCHGGATPQQLADLAESIPELSHGGIGVYNTFVHLDVRSGGPARWKG